MCQQQSFVRLFTAVYFTDSILPHLYKKIKTGMPAALRFSLRGKDSGRGKKKGMAETFLSHPFKLHFLQNLKQTGRMQSFILCKPCKHFRKSFVGCYLMSVSLIIAYKLGGILPSSEHSVSVCNLQMFFFVHALITSHRLLLSQNLCLYRPKRFVAPSETGRLSFE